MQLAGAIAGVAAAHLMFGEPVFSASHHVRSRRPQLFSEFVARLGLLCVIWGCARPRSSAVPFAVGAYADDRFDVESAGTKPSVVRPEQFRLCEKLA